MLEERNAILNVDRIVEFSPGQYSLRKASYVTLGSGASLLAIAHREAGDYCRKQGKASRTISESSVDGIPLDRYPGAVLTFECV